MDQLRQFGAQDAIVHATVAAMHSELAAVEWVMARILRVAADHRPSRGGLGFHLDEAVSGEMSAIFVFDRHDHPVNPGREIMR